MRPFSFFFAVAVWLATVVSIPYAFAAGDIAIPKLGVMDDEEVFVVCDGVEIWISDWKEPGADVLNAVTLHLKGESAFFVVVFEPKGEPEKEKTKVYIDSDRDGKAEQVMTFLELEARYETVCGLYEAARKGRS